MWQGSRLDYMQHRRKPMLLRIVAGLIFLLVAYFLPLRPSSGVSFSLFDVASFMQQLVSFPCSSSARAHVFILHYVDLLV